MPQKPDKSELASLVMQLDMDVEDEQELIRLLKDVTVSEDLSGKNPELSAGQKAADAITVFAGSWKFILAFLSFLIGWIIYNKVTAGAFDPFPFILLNLILSCVAAIQAPIILMSQNRQSERDRHTAKNDFRVNLKSEIILEDLHDRLIELSERHQALQQELQDLKDYVRKSE